MDNGSRAGDARVAMDDDVMIKILFNKIFDHLGVIFRENLAVINGLNNVIRANY